MDTTTNDSGSAFPVDRPVESLIRDHNLVRTLVETYRNSDSDAVKINAAEQILMLMETHSLLEESVFYPAVREIDPTLIGHFEQEHQKTDQILVELKRMSLNDPQALPLFEQLIELHLQHVEEEENQFFPRLEQAGIDMMPIGLQMQAFEANMVHVQAQATQQGAR
ncbi:MAG TPA: hemerythrin domain-containing protein [Noviherbaspirillum sp.]|jgi:hemerythrin superfamily protein|nr:hemerythrin domain-containing protein [Noviherbaspirillum sp.]